MKTTRWRDEILKEFTPQVARLTLVADPDGLLLEEGILQGIEERGLELTGSAKTGRIRVSESRATIGHQAKVAREFVRV